MHVTCECESDGFCAKYKRPMYGRMRQLCRGENVDIGTAAAFRQQWAREAGEPRHSGEPRKLRLKTAQAPGDAVVMTAAVYSLHRAHPGKFITSVDTPYSEVFFHNPDVSDCDGEELQMHYPAVHQCDYRGIHFMQGYCEFLESVLGVKVPLLTNRPRLYFPDVAAQEDFWVVCAGGKRDFTNKLWGKYQEVVDRVKMRWVQVGVGHELLRGAEYVRTTLRELFDLVRRCRGVLCGVSLLMHVAAAVERPAVVVAGGREPVQWNAYPKQHYLHTVGALDCCRSSGCWKSRLHPLGDNEELDASLCEHPGAERPLCMDLVTVDDVVARVQSLSQLLLP